MLHVDLLYSRYSMIFEVYHRQCCSPDVKVSERHMQPAASRSCHAARVDIRFPPSTQMRCDLKRWLVRLGNWKTDTGGDENAGYSALVTAKMYTLANQ